jgi:hypothetical protein
MEPHSGKRRPVWTASSQKTGPKWVWRGLVDLSTIFNGSTTCQKCSYEDKNAGSGFPEKVDLLGVVEEQSGNIVLHVPDTSKTCTVLSASS